MPVPCPAPPLGDSPEHVGSACATVTIPVGPDLWSPRPHTGVAEVLPGPCPIPVCPEVLTCPRKSFLPTMSQSQTSTLSTASPSSPSGSSNSSTSSQCGNRVFLITCWAQGLWPRAA